MPWGSAPWPLTTAGRVGPHSASKHSRQCYDSLRDRTWLTGGDRDGSDDGQPNIYYFVQSGGVTSHSTSNIPLTLVMPTTGSTGSPQAYSPHLPDNCTWVYSSVLDVMVIARSFWFQTTHAMDKQPTRSTDDWLPDNGIFNPTSSASKFGIQPWCYSSVQIPTPDPFWGGDSNSNFGTYDPVQNALVRLIWDGAWGCTMQVIPLGDLVTFPQATKFSCGSTHPSGSYLRNYIRNLDPHARQQALDVVGRKIYCVGQSQTLQSTSDHGFGLLRIDLNNPVAGEKLELPPMVPSSRRGDPATPGEVVFRPQQDPFSTNPETGTGGVDYILAFDSVRRQIMFPQIRGYGGEVYNTLIYDVATSVWSVVDSNGMTSTGPWPVGNCFSFNPIAACGMLTGGKGDPSQPMLNHPTITVETTIPSRMWYLTPGNSTNAQSTGSPTFVNALVTAVTGPVNVTSSITGGVYRFNAYDGATSSFISTVDSANPTVKFANFSGLILGKNYKFTGEHRTGSDTGIIGGSTGVATRYATLSGVPISTSSASGLDVNPPVITQIYPKSSDTVSGIISFQYNVTDTEGVARVELRVNQTILQSPVFDTNNLINGNAVNAWTVNAWDLSSNAASATAFFNVNNVSTPPPTPASTSDGVQAIWLNPTVPGRVGYVLWATVPAGEEIPRPGFRSAWPGAKTEELALLESGAVRERSGTMKIEGTDEEMKTRLIARWTEFNAEVQDLPDWTLENNFWNGTGWVAR